MDAKQLVMFALRVSILCTVFGFGLKATKGDLLFLVRRPGLLGRSLLAVFVIMPAVAALGSGTLVALILFVAIGLAVATFWEGPSRITRPCWRCRPRARHPAIALSLASSNFSDERFGGTEGGRRAQCPSNCLSVDAGWP